MAAVMMNAANIAYRRSIKKTRESAAKTNPAAPKWLPIFSDKLIEKQDKAARRPKKSSFEVNRRHMERSLKNSENRYDRVAWVVLVHVTSTAWFETFIMLNILVVGFATGLDLENNGTDAWVVDFVDGVGNVTLSVFTAECLLKIVACAREPLNYFTDPDDGSFNSLDFAIVLASFAFIGNDNGSAIGALRMLRLIRLLTLIKGVPVLRVIIIGTAKGMGSVVYILMLLLLVVYIFAIVGTLLFGFNDPARFGDIAISMLTLFQVSTLASWASIAYVSWFGCDNFTGSPYDVENGGDERGATSPSMIRTQVGDFQGFECPEHYEGNGGQPLLTFLFFGFYILITSWVIMSLFIGVISMGMFDAFIGSNEEKQDAISLQRHENNTATEAEGDPPPPLKIMIDAFWSEEKSEDKAKSHHRSSSGSSRVLRWLVALKALARKIRDHPAFVLVITALIMVVGVFSGVETDFTLACERTYDREHGNEDDNEALKKVMKCEQGHRPSKVVGDVAQAMFTIEVVVKLLAEEHPLNFFTDRDNSWWNNLDFSIVAIGFVELTPMAYVFSKYIFPVAILRLLRLLRVFRLAKALPQLRSIVEALISGLSSVGWICFMILVYQYIAGCMCMLLFRVNDPFHFGSLSRSMFTILRMQTLDSWDQILYLSMFGCDGFPAYDLLRHSPNTTCSNPDAFGWLAPLVLVPLAIIGSYILPPVLIGIVTMKFGDASKYFDELSKLRLEISYVVKEAAKDFPDFFTPDRIEALRVAFTALDITDNLSLDLAELSIYIQYSFAVLFGVELTTPEVEALFLIIDTDQSSGVGFTEVVQFSVVLKKVSEECAKDPTFARELFEGSSLLTPRRTFKDEDESDGASKESEGKEEEEEELAVGGMSKEAVRARKKTAAETPPSHLLGNGSEPPPSLLPRLSSSMFKANKKEAGKVELATSKWNRAVVRVLKQSMEETWDVIIDALQHAGDGEEDEEREKKASMSSEERVEYCARQLFERFDTDGSMTLDMDELDEGLDAIGTKLTQMQLRTFKRNMTRDIDADGDGEVDFDEFMGSIKSLLAARERTKFEATKREAASLLHLLMNDHSHDDAGREEEEEEEEEAQRPPHATLEKGGADEAASSLDKRRLSRQSSSLPPVPSHFVDIESWRAKFAAQASETDTLRRLLRVSDGDVNSLKARNLELESSRQEQPKWPSHAKYDDNDTDRMSEDRESSLDFAEPSPTRHASLRHMTPLPVLHTGKIEGSGGGGGDRPLSQFLGDHGLADYEALVRSKGVSEPQHILDLTTADIETIVPNGKPLIHRRKLSVLSLGLYENSSPTSSSSSMERNDTQKKSVPRSISTTGNVELERPEPINPGAHDALRQSLISFLEQQGVDASPDILCSDVVVPIQLRKIIEWVQTTAATMPPPAFAETPKVDANTNCEKLRLEDKGRADSRKNGTPSQRRRQAPSLRTSKSSLSSVTSV